MQMHVTYTCINTYRIAIDINEVHTRKTIHYDQICSSYSIFIYLPEYIDIYSHMYVYMGDHRDEKEPSELMKLE